MARTKFRSNQGVDEEFLTEAEGDERFIFREGYGINDANLLMDTNFFIESDRFHVDGYSRFTDLISDPTASLPSNSLYLYNKAGSLFSKNSVGTITQLGGAPLAVGFTPVIKLGATTLATSHAEGYSAQNGDIVTITLSIAYTASGTGSLTIEGLPVSARNESNLVQGLNVHTYEGITVAATFGRVSSIQATLQPGSSTLTIQKAEGSSNIDITDSDVSSGVIRITGSYISG